MTKSNNLRRQAKFVFVLYQKDRSDLKMIHDENNVLTESELVTVRNFLKMSKHACMFIVNEKDVKTKKQVTKDLERQEQSKKSHKT